MPRARILLAFSLVALALAACGKMPPLGLRLEPGRTDEYRVTVDAYDEMRIKGQYQTKYESHQIYDFDHRVLVSAAPGQFQTQVAYKRIRMQSDLDSGQIVRFDSDQRAEGANEFQRPLYAVLNKPLTMTVDKDGHIVKVDGFEAIVAAVRASLPPNQGGAALEAFQSHYGPAFLVNVFEPFYASMPPATKTQPPKWKRQRTIHNLMFGPLAFTEDCRLENPDETLSKITFSGVILPEEQGDAKKKPLPRAQAAITLRSGTVKGEMTVDRSSGSLEKLTQETVLLMGLDTDRPDAPAGQRATVKLFVARQ
jgi:hypothetical protein